MKGLVVEPGFDPGFDNGSIQNNEYSKEEQLQDKENLLEAAETVEVYGNDTKTPTVSPRDQPKFDATAEVSKGGLNWLTLVYCCAVTSSLTSILLGYDVGVISGAILYISEDLGLSTVQEEVLVGMLNLVAAFGGLVAGKAADQIGRRRAIGMACLIFISGAVVKIIASAYWMLLIGRIVTGVGVGCGFVIAPVYIAEITPPKIRGMLVSMTDISINFGILLGYLTAYVCTVSIDGLWKWRLMLGISIIPPIIILTTLFVLPESPRWLIQHGYRDQGLSVLSRIMPSQSEADEALTSIQDSIQGQEREASWQEVLSPEDKMIKRVILIALGLGFWQQASGSESVVYYTPLVLEGAGLESANQMLLGTMAVGCFKLGGEIVAALLVERCGRRPLLMTSVILQTLSIFGISAAIQFGATPIVDMVALCSFMWWFSIGLGPVTWVCAAELLPLRYRSKGHSMAVFLNRAMSGLCALTFLSLSNALTIPGGFLFYGIISFFSIFFYAFYIPETKGKSLEEIQKALALGQM
mmetsp:Transcript_28650/g.37550  ORF Transcript_28650/g.37550 Transcript_28650/m.37550 type:complete len:526 (-) Transcript_28650:172-1749(-)|eukprot:CAMPEP_0117802398 /NCGR_PEP_ID=MMETSP0948-20121206/15712_1 /TAXON_ID=44440 /ORGANISM="Chattonella subsalsa, Strain CCMP2191" /LENGTH=525 /DNA_ID=CAMNT_0005635201 /DNA_START=88 /DNA_END=1665 /DNA_ORIENTATION=+